ncbi:MAG: hypothetical protein LIO93_10305 [Bacteroidales bacterium]|nr:hypothetical protein [Bacteroidales bacterium]
MVPGKVKKRIVAPGERLTLISQEEYGHKSFWVYLYEENKELIKDPNNVMAGTNIVIPEPSKYGIDKENEESVHRAEKLAEKYKK